MLSRRGLMVVLIGILLVTSTISVTSATFTSDRIREAVTGIAEKITDVFSSKVLTLTEKTLAGIVEDLWEREGVRGIDVTLWTYDDPEPVRYNFDSSDELVKVLVPLLFGEAEGSWDNIEELKHKWKQNDPNNPNKKDQQVCNPPEGYDFEKEQKKYAERYEELFGDEPPVKREEKKEDSFGLSDIGLDGLGLEQFLDGGLGNLGGLLNLGIGGGGKPSFVDDYEDVDVENLRHFKSKSELQSFLRKDKTDWLELDDCDDYALTLQKNAFEQGFIIDVVTAYTTDRIYPTYLERELSDSGWHTFNEAICGNKIYGIEPQDDSVWFITNVDL